jgi:hypothetical protein
MSLPPTDSLRRGERFVRRLSSFFNFRVVHSATQIGQLHRLAVHFPSLYRKAGIGFESTGALCLWTLGDGSPTLYA